jgi:hypothetical protein
VGLVEEILLDRWLVQQGEMLGGQPGINCESGIHHSAELG